MKKFKFNLLFDLRRLWSLLNAAAISIAVFTTSSVAGYLLFGHGGFDLVTPFGVNRKNYTYNALVALIFYIVVGIFCYITFLLIKKGQLGLKLTTVIYFLSGILAFLIIGIAEQYQGGPISMYLDFYFKHGTFINYYQLLILPLILATLSCTVCYIGVWLSTRFELRLINKKIAKSKSLH